MRRINHTELLIIAAVIVLLMSAKGCSGSEIEDIASVIAAEACSDGPRGMHAVSSTIQTRARNRRVSPLVVVKQKNQYFGWTNPNRLSIYRGCKAEADNLARQVIAGTLEDIVFGAEYFLLDNERVRRWHGTFTVRIGAHRFYEEAK